MGEMADYYIEMEESNRTLLPRPQRKKRAGTWITSEGKELFINQMEDSHIMNCIHLSERREGYRGIDFLNKAPTYRALVEELISRKKLKYAYFDLALEERMTMKL